MAEKKKNVVEFEGVIKEVLPDTKFLVEIEVNGEKHEVLGHLSGKMRMHYIRLVQGNKVTIEITPYDSKRGRITYRQK